MRTAEEWCLHNVDRIADFSHWRYDRAVLIKLFQQIQLDAHKQGMTDAAKIVIENAVDLGRTPVKGVRFLIKDGFGSQDEVRKTYKQAILTARDKKTTI